MMDRRNWRYSSSYRDYPMATKKLEKLSKMVAQNDPIIEEHNLRKIVLADKDEYFRDALKNSISSEIDDGLEILYADRGDEAIDLYNEHKPGLIIIELRLPDKSGFIVTDVVKRSHNVTKALPGIFIATEEPGQRHKEYAETLGIEFYLNKPFRIPKLIDRVREFYTALGVLGKSD